MRYPVNEIFNTIQGEGCHVGKPATFIRLQGCPVGCAWCDTKHTWPVREEDKVDIQAVLAKGSDASATWAEMLVHQIAQLATLPHVVITGGEPCLYDLGPLSTRLARADHSVQIETSGTHEVRVDKATWVTVAPKVNMAGGFPVLDSALRRADEIKFPVGRARDIEVLHKLLERVRPFQRPPVYLAPLSLSETATQLCVREAIKNNWGLSIQTHKYIGLR